MKGDFSSVIERHAFECPDHAALVFASQQITYARLNEQVNRVANALLNLGLRAGDRIASLLPQCPPFAVLYLAAGRIGLVLVPLDPRFKVIEMKTLCERSRPRVLVALGSPEPMQQAVNALMASYPFEHVFTWPETPGNRGSRPFDELLDGDPTRVADQLRPHGDDPWVIIFTSGTTGRPKGAVLSHANSAAIAQATVRQWKIQANDVSFCNLPTSHVAGTHNQLAVMLYAGATGIMVPKFDPVQTLELIAEHKVTYFGGVPTMFRLMFRRCDPRDYDTSSVRAVITAGEPASAELVAEIAEAFPQATVLASWGMSETCGFFTFTGLKDGLEIVEQTEGRPDPQFKMKVVDSGGAALPAGQVGELWVRGASVMRSYMDTDDNKEALVDGWLRTGDLGFLDDAGYLHFAGRAKEMYISGGYNVYPLEIESFLNAAPGVNTSAVIAVPHPVWGEVGIAFVVPEEGVELEVAQLAQYCRDGLADYKQPAKIVLQPDLPRSLVGKIAKMEVRARLDQYLDADS